MAARTAPLVLLSVKVQPQTVRVVRPSRPRPGRRRLLAAALAVFAALVGVAAIATPAQADPEGGTAEMRRQLDEAQRGYLDAKAALDASVARQQELATTLESIEVQLAEEEKIVGEIGRHAFMSAGFSGLSGILASGSAESFLDNLSLVNALATREGNAVRRLLDTRANAQAAQEEIEVEVAMQSELFAEMENRKQQAQQALWAVGGGAPVAGFSAAASVVAEPAPRNASGGWSSEARSVYESRAGRSRRGRPTPWPRPRPPDSPGTSPVTGRWRMVGSIRAGGRVTSPWMPPAATAGMPSARPRTTATTSPRSSSSTPTGSGCCT
jgi:hypothetical protein